MSHKSKKSLVRQVQERLDSMLRIGSSKHDIKRRLGIQHGTQIPGIYSWGTYRAYLQHCCYFVRYCRQKHGCKTLEQCQQYAAEWIDTRKNLSAYTQKLEASALCKLYGATRQELRIVTKKASRNAITRSRGTAARDAHFSEEKNRTLVDFCRATGLRRSELSALRGDQLIRKEDAFYIRVHGKGGRYREALVLDPGAVVLIMVRARHGKVFPHIHSAADIHSYRADYATAVYMRYARPIESLTYKDLYYCRKDKKGIVYDRKAMLIASRYLGHNRIDVIGEHYLRL